MVTSKYSPYAVAQSEPPKWMPGEDMAAAAFTGAAIFIVVDVNVGIWRVFKRKQGLYYWSMLIGINACFVDAIGVILKFLAPNTKHIWGLYTALLLTGWSFYAPAQLLVLYSRMHLVNSSRKTQRGVLYLILSTLLFIIVPTWIVVWPAYYPNPKVSSVWSPRDAIVERYNQIGFTFVECVISGTYIWSLLHILRIKSSVRQRRVMLDLINVNIIILALDVLVVVLVYLNQTGLSHPMQTFSYAVKMKIEFVVLNQLMAVAARGVQRENFAERRYHHGSRADGFSAECREWGMKGATKPQRTKKDDQNLSQSMGSFEMTIPSPVLTKQHQTSKASTTKRSNEQWRSHPPAPNGKSDDNTFRNDHDHDLRSFLDAENAAQDGDQDVIRNKPSEAYSDETLLSSEGTAGEKSPHLHSRGVRGARDRVLESLRHPRGRSHQGERECGDQDDGGKLENSETTATIKRRVPKTGRNSAEDDDEEEEIGVHMWENRKGSLMMEVPWFKRSPEP